MTQATPANVPLKKYPVIFDADSRKGWVDVG